MTVHLTRIDCEGFEKCCVSSAVDKTDGDMLWNGRDEDGKVNSYYVENEGIKREDGDSDIDW